MPRTFQPGVSDSTPLALPASKISPAPKDSCTCRAHPGDLDAGGRLATAYNNIMPRAALIFELDHRFSIALFKPALAVDRNDDSLRSKTTACLRRHAQSIAHSHISTNRHFHEFLSHISLIGSLNTFIARFTAFNALSS